jgi:Fic family protein
MAEYENPSRIEPARIDEPTVALADAIADLTASTAILGRALHPKTAANLSDLVRVMNTYYSNLIEGHNTRPRDIERALRGDFDADENGRSLQMEAAAHVRVQQEIDALFSSGQRPVSTSEEFICWIHRAFYRDAPESMLRLEGGGRAIVMEPGALRSKPEHDNAVGRHLPPSSEYVADFLRYFSRRYDVATMGTASRILAIPAAHHRFNYIHPFPDGNGRVSRLMSHAMAQEAGIGAHGLWSVSRGLSRGLESRGEYKQMMALADSPRLSDLDGRGNLSLRALQAFADWFLKVCLDQVRFMAELFDLETLRKRLRRHVETNETLRVEGAALLEEALIRGEFERGEISRITGLPRRSASRVMSELLATGLLASDTERGPLSLRFPQDSLETLFPRLYPQT